MVESKTPFELGKIAGKTYFETKEQQPCPDFYDDYETEEWELGCARGYRNAEVAEERAKKEAQNA